MTPSGKTFLGEVPLVEPSRFLSAARESGYRSTSSALAELVDNAIQAKARRIDIVVRQEDEKGEIQIAVIDDGEGMKPADFARALQFGGTNRFNDRSGLGRFGMGLPNASISQARRIDLFSWGPNSRLLHAYLDADDFSDGATTGILSRHGNHLPAWLRSFQGDYRTAVIWSRCDRILSRRISTLVALLKEELGRMFRALLSDRLELRVNTERLAPIDPIRVYPRPDSATVEILPNLDIPFASAITPEAGLIRVQFTVLPIEAWSPLPNELKRRFRITKWGGVSILRARREIAYGWLLLGGKRRENYDDWWRAEISFPPSLDGAFGVTHTKQGIRPSSELFEALVPTLEAQARRLNRLVRQRFEQLNTGAHSAELRAERRHSRLRHSDVGGVSRNASASIRGVRYRLLFEDSRERQLARTVYRKSLVTVYINRLHPFYTRLYLPLIQRDCAAAATALDSLLLAVGRVKLTREIPTEELLARFSDACAVFMESR